MNRFIVAILLGSLLVACSTADLARKRADRYYKMGDYANAAKQYQEVENIEGATFDTSYSMGQCAHYQQDWVAACEHFEKARAEKPDFPGSYENLAVCYRKQNKMDKVKSTMEALLKIDSKNGEAHKTLGNIYFDEEIYSKAQLHYSEYLLSKPDDVPVRSSLGATFTAGKQYVAAIEVLKKAIALDATHVNSRYNLGMAYLGGNRTDDAIRELTVVTEMKPGFSEGWIGLSTAYIRQGDLLKSIEVLERAKSAGFKDWLKIDRDSTFTPLITHDRYMALVGSAKPRMNTEDPKNTDKATPEAVQTEKPADN